jgi:hypothetical protein
VWPRELALRRRLPPEVAVVLTAFALWTLVPLLTLAGQGGVFNGGYGIDVPDLMQYMAFIRDSGQHLLISNRFDIVADRHLFLDPVFAISGLVWRLGASIQFALLMWVPIAAAAVAAGFTAYVRRLLGSNRAAVAVALVLAFFYLAPALALADWLHWSGELRFGTQVVGLEMFAGAYAWGSGPAIAIAVMPVFLLAIERLLDPSRRAAGRSAAWYAGWASLAGLLASWLHPWQGITLLLILCGLVVWGRAQRRYISVALPAVITAAPLVYFFVLSHTHSSWMAVARPNNYAHFGWWLALGLAPLLLAVPGFRGRELDLQERMLRIWPVAALAVYVALDRTWFYHALAALSLPFAILAVKGWRGLRLPRALAAVAVALVTVPGLVWVVQQLVKTREQHFFKTGEAAALAYLDRERRPGPVLAPVMPLGQAVPAFAGRLTYVGHYYWTPDYGRRAAAAEQLFDGRLPRAEAVAFVRTSGVAFLLSDCQRGRVDLAPILGNLIVRVKRFDCASVYELRASGFHAQIMSASPPRIRGPISYPARPSSSATVAAASAPGR